MKKQSKRKQNQSQINIDVKDMIHHLQESGVLYLIENNINRIIDNMNQIDNKQLVLLHNSLIEQIFIKKQYNFIMDLNKGSINITDIYSQILQQDLPTLREMMQYKGVIKLLYFLKLQFQIHEVEINQNVKYSYIKFRSKSLKSLIPAVEQIKKVLAIYNQNISNLSEDIINHCLNKRTLLAQNLYLESSNFLTFEKFQQQYQKIKQYWYYVNMNPDFDPIRLIILSKFQQYFGATLNLPLENNFYQLVTYIQSGAKSLSKQYENSIILDDDTEMVYAMTMFKPVAICYLLSKQNYIQQYELSLCREIFLNNTNTTKELDKIMLHIKCETLEVFDDTIVKFIKNCNLYESIVILNYMVSYDLIDTISNTIFKVLSSQLDKMVMLQITNKRIQSIKSFDTPLQRIQEVVYAFRKIQMKIEKLQNCGKQESVLKILLLEQKAQTIIQFVQQVLTSQGQIEEQQEGCVTRNSVNQSKPPEYPHDNSPQTRPVSQLTNDNPLQISDISNLSQIFATLKNENRQINVYLDDQLLTVQSVDVNENTINIYTKSSSKQ